MSRNREPSEGAFTSMGHLLDALWGCGAVAAIVTSMALLSFALERGCGGHSPCLPWVPLQALLWCGPLAGAWLGRWIVSSASRIYVPLVATCGWLGVWLGWIKMPQGWGGSLLIRTPGLGWLAAWAFGCAFVATIPRRAVSPRAATGRGGTSRRGT